MVTSRKRVKTYQNITNFNSLEGSEFLSELKPEAVTNKEFENSKFLFVTLKMRSLSIRTTSIISKMSIFYMK